MPPGKLSGWLGPVSRHHRVNTPGCPPSGPRWSAADLAARYGTQVTARYDDDHNRRELARAPGASGQRLRSQRAALK